MNKLNLKELPDEVVANLAEKIENLPVSIQDYLTLKDLVVDEENYYYPVYNHQGEVDSFEILASKRQILGEEFDVNLE